MLKLEDIIDSKESREMKKEKKAQTAFLIQVESIFCLVNLPLCQFSAPMTIMTLLVII